MVGDCLVGAGLGIGWHFDGCEHLVDLVLDTIYIYVAYNNYGLLVRTIPCLIIVAEGLRGEVVNDFHSSYRQAASVFSSGEEFGKNALENTHLSLHGATPFLMDHAALFVNLLGVKCKVVSPVVEDEEAGVLNAFTSDGHIGDVVHSLIDRGVRIEVLAEFDSD